MNLAQVSALFVTLLTQCAIPEVLSEHCDFLLNIRLLEEECYSTLAGENQSLETGCRGMWDSINCWRHARVGETVEMPCPWFPGIFLNTEANVSRNCTSEGWSNLSLSYLTACEIDNSTLPSEQKQLYRVVMTSYTIGHSLSLISLTVAMVILCIFRKLRCTRNYIHMNLFLSFILKAISVFVKDLILFEDFESDCSVSKTGCKPVMVLFHYCIMANNFWLLVEGLYLHTLLVISSSERKYMRWYMLLGWGFPLLFVIAWSLGKYYLEEDRCWQIINSSLWWIIRAPILVIILINFILFVCIIRILIQKLHSPDIGLCESSQQYWRLSKSTLLLIPLFGINYIVFAFFPDSFRPEIKVTFDLALGSFQGFIVAVLYCFLNGEVQSELKRRWRRWHIDRCVSGEVTYHQPSTVSSGACCTSQTSTLTNSSPKTRGSIVQAKFSIS
ncbi:vasoactive intestinal polypeptide receptor 1b isoform X1 [Mobula birostris]|uniref:vasoactive intestinal polypeptide receptor 1b isoform X1 n=1 Tax=Mobula birostris TaxID=1983395 RepID=UPI003B28B571